MEILTGTSGFSYPGWRGSFYPRELAAAKMLAFYAAKLDAVEINNSFYRVPERPVLERWAAETPPSFRFALKSPGSITHMKRLVGAGDIIKRLTDGARVLGDRLGPVLFGLPATLRKDVRVLDRFLGALPEGVRAAFEFRDESWFADDVYAVLRRHDAALCVADSEELTTPLVATARWGYLRLRRSGYGKPALRRWAKRLAEARFERAFVFFKHETKGAAPVLAHSFKSMMI
jgi:uncharacterized protein YecE (DUF72 family)